VIRSLFVGIVFLSAGVAAARMIVVPSDAPTIQAGLDSLRDLDTVFVELGTYQEILIAPAIRFTILGEAQVDSSGVLRPVLDGSNVSAHDTTALLRLPIHSALTMRNMVFRHHRRVGIFSWADSVILANCLIENVATALQGRMHNINAIIRLDSCVFNDLSGYGVGTGGGNSLIARDCAFYGTGTSDAALAGGYHCDIARCEFAATGNQILLHTTPGRQTIRSCVFGPALGFSTSERVSLDGSYIDFEDNIFRDCRSGYMTMDIWADDGDSVSVLNNSFINCTGTDSFYGGYGTLGVFTMSAHDRGALISDNTFVECSGTLAADCIAAAPFVPALIENNHFIRDSLNGAPSVYAGNPSWQPAPLTLINNRWENCGYAVDLSAAADARENFWGHNSGPYHAEFNPEGQGDTITGNVPFIPWLTDSTDAADDPVIVPNDFALVAYPNPFNATTTLQYALSQPSTVSLKVFDLLGREVRTLANEVHEAGTYDVEFDGAALASSIYFARLETPQASRVTRLLLLK